MCVWDNKKTKGVGCQVLIGLIHMTAFVVDFTNWSIARQFDSKCPLFTIKLFYWACVITSKWMNWKSDLIKSFLFSLLQDINFNLSHSAGEFCNLQVSCNASSDDNFDCNSHKRSIFIYFGVLICKIFLIAINHVISVHQKLGLRQNQCNFIYTCGKKKKKKEKIIACARGTTTKNERKSEDFPHWP